MKKRITPVTLHYMIITGGFWMSFCVISSYAAVFLQGIGYNNQELGLILALGNVGGTVLSTVLASWIDRNRQVRHASVIFLLLAVQTVLLIALRVWPQRSLLSAVCYTLYIAAIAPVNALNLDLCVRLEHAGAPLAFGVARSMGSFAFMILSVLLGVLTEAFSFLVLPLAGIAVILLQAGGNLLIDRDLREAEKRLPAAAAAGSAGRGSSLLSFVRDNKAFCVMMLGTVLIFTGHNIDGNFLINEIEALGGGTAIMGYVAAFTAIVEVPVMMFSSRLPDRWSKAVYIRFSLIMFVFKMAAYALAPSIPLFFAARILQAPSYALYTVLIVSYADETVPAKDSAKAQSIAYSMTTVGSVLASLIGGRLFDMSGVQTTQIAAVLFAAVGTAVAVAGVRDKGKSLTRKEA